VHRDAWAFIVNSELHTGKRPSVRLCVGLLKKNCTRTSKARHAMACRYISASKQTAAHMAANIKPAKSLQ
jgi:hypothetical protein